MDDMVQDIVDCVTWVHKNASLYGGDEVSWQIYSSAETIYYARLRKCMYLNSKIAYLIRCPFTCIY